MRISLKHQRTGEIQEYNVGIRVKPIAINRRLHNNWELWFVPIVDEEPRKDLEQYFSEPDSKPLDTE